MPRDVYRYGRTHEVCVAAGIDLDDWLVRRGLARDYGYYQKAIIGPCRTRLRSIVPGCGRANSSNQPIPFVYKERRSACNLFIPIVFEGDK